MIRINEIQNEIIQTLNEIGDGFEQYSYLLELAMQLPPMEEKLKTSDRLVEGCQSKVWLEMNDDGGKLSLEADSDTLIMKGVLEILREILNGQQLQDVAEAEIKVFEETEILASFNSDRQKGIGYILKQIREFAKK